MRALLAVERLDGVGTLRELRIGEVRLRILGQGREVTAAFLWLEKRRALRLDVVSPNSAGVLGLSGPAEDALTARVVVTMPEGSPPDYRARLTLVSGGASLPKPARRRARAASFSRSPGSSTARWKSPLRRIR